MSEAPSMDLEMIGALLHSLPEARFSETLQYV
jgi:hypothetical protein